MDASGCSRRTLDLDDPPFACRGVTYDRRQRFIQIEFVGAVDGHVHAMVPPSSHQPAPIGVRADEWSEDVLVVFLVEPPQRGQFDMSPQPDVVLLAVGWFQHRLLQERSLGFTPLQMRENLAGTGRGITVPPTHNPTATLIETRLIRGQQPHHGTIAQEDLAGRLEQGRGTPVPTILRQCRHVGNHPHGQHLATEMHLAIHDPQVRQDLVPALDQESIGRLVARFLQLRLKLGQ